MKSNRIALLCLAATLVLVLLPTTALAQTTHIVTVGDNFFSPSSLTIQVGDTVEWRNASGGNQHNVTANNGSFASSTSSSFTFSQTFNATGTVNYRCTVHGAGMTGVIIVQGAASVADVALQGVDAAAGTYAPGDSINIEIDLENLGNAASGAFEITYYASTNTTINSVDTELGTDARPNLNAGQSSSFTATAEFPNDIAPGNYFIGAIVDVNDSNSSNNTNHDPTAVTIAAAPAEPDIALQSVDAVAGTYAPGDPINIDIDLQNIGEAASGAFDITYYASPNATITSSDTELGTDARPSLNAGQASSFTANADFPVNIAPGNYFIGAIVDIDDSNSANNVNHDASTVTVQAPVAGFLINAGMNDTWFNPATAGQGFFITVFPDIQKMFLAWFTYDKERPPQDVTAMLGEPGHRWLTAFGDYSGDTATLEVELTQGGVFNTAPPAPTQGPDGTITVEFTGCNSGEVNYHIPSSNSTGSVAIQRIALDNVPFCESLQPD